MRYVLFSTDPDIVSAFKSAEALFPTDETVIVQSREACLSEPRGSDMLFVDILATLDEPHRIAGYEKFYEMISGDPEASKVPLVLISMPTTYDIDFVVGWPDFVFANMPRPVTPKLFRRASTWI